MIFSIGTLTVSGTDELPASYHTGEGDRVASARRNTVRRSGEYNNRQMIAWDGEGMKLSGDDKSQHYVLFGCSADRDNPLIGKNLDFRKLADYALSIAVKHPRAFHVGYFFKYDQNMIIKSLGWRIKIELYETGKATYVADGYQYRISYVPGKKIRITRIDKGTKERVSILIEDIAAFWAQSFVAAYRQTFPDAEDDPTFQRVIEGKKLRATMMWEDMPIVRDYWYHEILALERLATRLKEMMIDAGFPLLSWYGPGAFANLMRRKFNLVTHEWGGKEANLTPTVHTAIKSAYYGGHFEQYKVGRIAGPVYAYDINSAYPAAFLSVPTMQEGGRWERVPLSELQSDSARPESALTVYYVKYNAGPMFGLYCVVPMPLPHRDRRGNTTYPQLTEGWYWAPEVSMMRNTPYWNEGLTVIEGWRWVPLTDELPWNEVIIPMYRKRQALKKAKDPAQMVFKLGPNSLYGKMAQRVGYNKETGEPPRAHTLCIAGYITSWCRANLLGVLRNIPDADIIAVETDGIYCRTSPEEILRNAKNDPAGNEIVFSKELGDWGVETYSEVIYLQNGVYLTRKEEEWQPAKTRGFPAGALTPELASEYLATLEPRGEWKTLDIPSGETFLGLGTAIARSVNIHGKINPFKADNLHCRWFPDHKQIDAQGSKGKRKHLAQFCKQCRLGFEPNVRPHNLTINSMAMRDPVSSPYRLPWEKEYEEEQWRTKAVGEVDSLPLDTAT